MKQLAVIANGRNTSEAFRAQLSDVLGERARIAHYCLDEGRQAKIEADVALLSSKETYERARSCLAPSCRVIVARRSINYHEVDKLFTLAPGTDVMLVNDFLCSAEETIALLRTSGADHINYHPYAPEMERYVRCPIAVTPGEKELVPPFAERIIDIKTRLIDITTLIQVLIYMESIEQYADFLSARYVRDMIRLIKRGTEMVRESERMKTQFEAVINTVHDGIIATDEDARVSVFNPVAEELLRLSAREAIGSGAGDWAYEKLRKIMQQATEGKESLVKSHGRTMVVNAVRLRPEENSGSLYTLKDVSEIRRLEESIRRRFVNEQKTARYAFSDIVGDSAEIQATLSIARKMADSLSTILIQGESGTGKELIAQGIHNASARRGGPFVAVNFAALTESLLESELFGYVEGAFTGAGRGGAPGLFEEAHKGTIFLDEIGDAPLPFQVKLLRVLQERQIRRVGSAKVIPIDVRVIVATNRDLKALIAQKLFRQDLYYRLHVLPIHVPPLRARGGDILKLAAFFYERIAPPQALPPAQYFAKVAGQMEAYDWPGNIRELQNVVEYLLHICADCPPAPEALPGEFGARTDARACDIPKLTQRILEEIAAANACGASVGRRSLANRLGLPESRVRRLLQALEQEGRVLPLRGRKGLQLKTPL